MDQALHGLKAAWLRMLCSHGPWEAKDAWYPPVMHVTLVARPPLCMSLHIQRACLQIV